MLCQILLSDYFQDEKAANEINIHTLILLGLILCPGDNKLKARVFYDVLQDSLQETISANDKDFQGTFKKLIDLAAKLPYDYQHEVNGGERLENPKVNEDLIDTMKEAFLDAIFDNSAKLTRNEYMDLVISKANWIFTSKGIREKVKNQP